MRLDLNFASREYILLRKLYALLSAGALFCIALFAVLYYMHQRDIESLDALNSQVAVQQDALERAEKELKAYSRTVDKNVLRSTYTEAAFANAAITRRVFSWTLFLGRIEDIVPKGVGITSIRPDFKSLDVNIAGTATNMETLTDFLEMLTRSEYFADIPPTFQTTEEKLGPDIGKVVQRFNFKIRYIPDPTAPEPAGVDAEGG